MIMAIYKRAFAILMRKPFRLWGISLLGTLLSGVGCWLFGIVPGLSIAISLLLSTGLTMVYLHGYRGEEVKSLDLFECFKDWATIKRVLCGMGWMILWIFIWALIPFAGIVFAIIRAYEYRLTPYILVQEPDVKPTEAIKLSKERTKGWKGKMFGADILVYVAYYVGMIILLALSRIPVAGFIFGIIAFLVSVCFFILLPLFLGLVRSAFYEEIQKWGTYPGRAAYVPVKPAPAAPGGYPQYAPQGYDPQTGAPLSYQQPPQYAPQGYDPQTGYPIGYQQPPQYPPQGYDPQTGYPVGYQPPQPGYQPPQPTWQPPAAPDPNAWQPPAAPDPNAWQPPAAPDPNAWQPPAAPDPNAWQPPVASNPDAWQQPPQDWTDAPQE